MDRRSFVKTCVGVAGAGALAASGLGLAAGLAIPRKPGLPPVRYFGAHRVAGPAPRGIPYIPITVKDGVIVGRTTGLSKAGVLGYDEDGVEIDFREWFKYCGHSGAPGLSKEGDFEDTLTYLPKEEYEHLITPWFKPYLDQPIRVDHFPGENFGAAFKWRSDGQTGSNVITGVVIRAPVKEVLRVESAVPPAKPISEAEMQWVRENVFHEEDGKLFIAVSSYCTHFCCAPGYREAEKLARPRDAWDNIFCTCHNSNYNYRQPVWYSFAPEVATESGGFDPLLARGGSSGGGGH